MTASYRNVIVWDGDRENAELCDVTLNGARISSVKKAEAGALLPDEFDGKGKTALLPGFVNAHGHSAMTLLRGLGEELPLMEWLEKRIWPVENRLTGELVAAGTQLAMLEMLSTGTTCFADMYFFMEDVAQTALKAGMKCGLCRGLIGGDEVKLEENIKLAKDYNGFDGLITVQLGPHAPYMVPFDWMCKISETAKENDLGIQLHWLEAKNEWTLTDMYGRMTPEEYLEKSGMTGVKHLLLAHAVWMDKDKCEFYARENFTVAHNPKSNLKLGSGVAPIEEMLKNGVAVSIGTDGAASNNRLDMWDELRFASLLQKGINNSPAAFSAKETLKAATVNGARALGFDKTGLIKEGFSADVILVDLDGPHYTGLDFENLPEFIVYAGSAEDIIQTVVAGKVLYDKGEFTTLDKEAAIARGAEARKRITGN